MVESDAEVIKRLRQEAIDFFAQFINNMPVTPTRVFCDDNFLDRDLVLTAEWNARGYQTLKLVLSLRPGKSAIQQFTFLIRDKYTSRISAIGGPIEKRIDWLIKTTMMFLEEESTQP